MEMPDDGMTDTEEHGAEPAGPVADPPAAEGQAAQTPPGGTGDPGPSDIYDPDRPPFEELPERPPRAARPADLAPEPQPLVPRAAITRAAGGLAAAVAAVLALLLRRRRRRARGA